MTNRTKTSPANRPGTQKQLRRRSAAGAIWLVWILAGFIIQPARAAQGASAAPSAITDDAAPAAVAAAPVAAVAVDEAAMAGEATSSAGSGADSASYGTGDRMEPLPSDLEGIGIEEHLNAQIPLDLTFTDEEGRTVQLAEYFTGQRPVVLNLAYYTCPMLCIWLGSPGKEYVVVTVSINPDEVPELAGLKKANYIEELGRPEAAGAWHFLTGEQSQITALAETVGFKYRQDPQTGEFIHTAGTFICTPDGRISRYLYGIEYEPQTFRLALLEASEGRIGTTLDRIILYCYHYDSASGRYAPAAIAIMRLGGGAAAVLLGVALTALWRRDRRRRFAAEGGVQA